MVRGTNPEGGYTMTTKGTHGHLPQLEAQPILGQRGKPSQPFGTMVLYPIDLSEKTRSASAAALNQILVDSMYLRDMYKKHHWQVTGPTFFQLHLLFDKHFQEQVGLVDMIG